MSLLAKHSLSKIDNSNIIQIAAEAKTAKITNPNVINATIGMLFDENEEFYCFDVVKKAEKKLKDIDKYAYSNTLGTTKFIEGVLDWVFQDSKEDFIRNYHASVVATPGGSGAISNTFSNYLNIGEKVLLPSFMWSNYKQVAYENHLEYTTYNMFNKNNKFDLVNLKDKFLELKASQGRILFVLNDPCHNPTGYSMTHAEWEELIKIINEVTADNTPFIFLYDMAYIDYDNNGLTYSRSNINLIKDLNESVLTILAFSGSKTLGLYGLRIGAMIGVSKNKENIKDFLNANQFSSRTKYSMATTYGMNLIGEILTNDLYKNSFINELDNVRKMLSLRAQIFKIECEKNDIELVPFKCGFFITIPCKDDELLFNYLKDKGVYVVPLNGFIRIAIASINYNHCKLLPSILAEAMKKIA